MKFDVMVQQLLEYWNINYSNAASISQKPQVPEVPSTTMTGLFPQAKPSKKRTRKYKNRH